MTTKGLISIGCHAGRLASRSLRAYSIGTLGARTNACQQHASRSHNFEHLFNRSMPTLLLGTNPFRKWYKRLLCHTHHHHCSFSLDPWKTLHFLLVRRQSSKRGEQNERRAREAEEANKTPHHETKMMDKVYNKARSMKFGRKSKVASANNISTPENSQHKSYQNSPPDSAMVVSHQANEDVMETYNQYYEASSSSASASLSDDSTSSATLQWGEGFFV